MKWLWAGRPDADTRLGLGIRYPWWVWALVLTSFALAQFLVWGLVHNIVDMRVCLGYSPDPVLKLIPYDTRWTLVTRDMYVWACLVGGAAVFILGGFGKHTPALRWGLGLTFMQLMRTGTLLLIPLCRPTVVAGAAPPLTSPEMVNLHFFQIPFRIFALNDMVFSGHTSVFLTLLLATATWPTVVRALIAIFLAFMIYGMLAMRDHFIIDVLLAFPCSYFADAIGCFVLRKLNFLRPPQPAGS